MKKILREIVLKNILLILILSASYFPIYSFFTNNPLIDKATAGVLVTVASIIAVTACFANFEFTYEKIRMKKNFQRYFAHFTTGLFLLVIGVSLIFTQVLTEMLIGEFWIMSLTFFGLYTACALYDIWDVLKSFNKKLFF